MGITQKQNGFTIIEVSAFVAISGLLLMGVMTGITTAVNQQRFRDTVNSAQNILQQEFSKVQLVNNSSSSLDGCGVVVGGSSNCSIIGKLIDLGKPGGDGDGSVITSYDIVINSNLPPTQELQDKTLVEILNANGAKIIDNSNKQTLPIDWGGSLKEKTTGGYSRYLAIIQNPVTGDMRIYSVTDDNGNFPEDTNLSFNDDGGKTRKFVDGDIKDNYTLTSVCIESQDIVSLKGTLNIAQGGSPDAVTVDFKGEDC